MADINFGKKKKTTKDVRDIGAQRGSYEDMVKHREKKMPQMIEALEEFFENWQGESFAVVMVNEDENGMPIGTRTLMTGAGRPETQVQLAHGLGKAEEQAIEVLSDGIAELGREDRKIATMQVMNFMDFLKGDE